jgi:hypothetical protein
VEFFRDKQVGLKNVALCLLLKGCDQAASNSFEMFAAADPDVRNHLGRSGMPRFVFTYAVTKKNTKFIVISVSRRVKPKICIFSAF